MVLELRGPVVISLEVTTLCNSNCPGCSNVFPHEHSEKLLTAPQWDSLIRKLSPYVQEFRITGGEPILRSDLFDILSSLEEEKKYYHIFTNGLWKDADAMADRFQSFAHLSSFLVSLHGHTGESHLSFAGKDSFQQVTGTIRTLVQAGFEVNTNAVLTKDNAKHIEDLVNLSCELGAKGTVFNRYIGIPREGVSVSEEELQGALEKIDELQKQGYNCLIGNCVPYCFFPSSSSGCLAGITFGTVDPFGNLRPCNHSPRIIGSLLKEEVSHLWKSKALRKWREQLPRECSRCIKLSYCPSGCRAIADLLSEPCDPLIRGHVKKERLPEKILEITLEEDLCPSPRFITRQEEFGLALIHHTQVIPVSHRAKAIIEMVDGKTTLREIEKRHGSASLSFLYSLYIRNFIDFSGSRP
ncbi:MAG: radical SAM protein [Candidatus Eremiobacteraeota bacterium]|nr:radical SAM protein [Candidatus Eremiobacteraeota bacterium]